MVWDLSRALHKKAEVETARLQVFAFQQRARAIGLMAQSHGLNGKTLASELAVVPDDLLIAQLCRLTGQDQAGMAAAFQTALADAWQQLAAEQGDPTPHRLA